MSGKGRSVADESQTQLVADHIERGLDRYGRGELVAAIREWEVALRLDPSNLKARQYIQYVRENFESLADYFGRVIDQPPPSPDGTSNWPGGQSPAETATFIRQEAQRWGAVIREFDIVVD